jgi:lipoate-protein ligase A
MTTPAPLPPPHRVFLDEDRALGNAPADVALGPALLREGLAGAAEVIRIFTPEPTAAFSRRDSLHRGFRAAVQAAEAAGFAPVLRGPGGRLAAYHRGSVVIDHVVRMPDSSAGTTERFELYAEQHAGVLRDLGVDARIGELDGEYCPGAFSVNAAGRAKIIGSAQRVTRDGWMFSSVVQVNGSRELREVLRETYEALGYRLELSTVGALEDFVPGVTTEAVTLAFRRLYSTGEQEACGVTLPGPVAAEVRRRVDLLGAELDRLLGKFSSPKHL